MPRSKPPRRAYRPRSPAIPVTGIVNEFAREFDVALLAMREGFFSEHFYNAIGQGLNVIGVAMEHRSDLRDAAILVGSAAAAMNAIDARKQRTGQWGVTVFELEPIRAGINAALEALPRFTINELYTAMKRVHALQAMEASGA